MADRGAVPEYTSSSKRAGSARSVVKRGVKRARRRDEKRFLRTGDYDADAILPRHIDGWVD